jgi:hypothetical protein
MRSRNRKKSLFLRKRTRKYGKRRSKRQRGGSETTHIVIADNIIDYAFKGRTDLTSVVITDSVSSIGDGAFDSCTGLTSVVIPNSVSSIGEDAFSRCSGLISVVIPDSVSSIGDHAFMHCNGLTSIVIPNSVISIGDYAFMGCIGLTLIVIPDSVKSIREAAFMGCTGLTSIVIPDSVSSIGVFAFMNCSGLTSIVIPESVVSIGQFAFAGCSGLTSIVIPDSVKSIGSGAFSGCKQLENVIAPPEFNVLFPEVDWPTDAVNYYYSLKIMNENDRELKDYTGNGKITYKNGDIYQGELVKGKRHGRGIYKHKKKINIIYKGHYDAGEGSINFSSGAIFNGKFKNGFLYDGTLTFINGDTYKGKFENNLMNGHGIFTYKSGVVHQGIWEQNVFIPDMNFITSFEIYKCTGNNCIPKLNKQICYCPITLEELTEGNFVQLSDGGCYSFDGLMMVFREPPYISPLNRNNYNNSDIQIIEFVKKIIINEQIKAFNKKNNPVIKKTGLNKILLNNELKLKSNKVKLRSIKKGSSSSKLSPISTGISDAPQTSV